MIKNSRDKCVSPVCTVFCYPTPSLPEPSEAPPHTFMYLLHTLVVLEDERDRLATGRRLAAQVGKPLSDSQ